LRTKEATTAGRYLSMQTALRRKVRRAKDATRRLVFASERRHIAVRRHLAGRYLEGDGLEVGALHLPLSLPRGARARYVDRMSVADLRAHYPELDEYELVNPDFIDDGEALTSVPDASMDFVIVNHLIEHCQDPIGALLSHARVLREGGVLYLAAPDRRRTDFDREREETSLEHLLRDHEQGPEGSRSLHYEEWSRLAIKVPEGDVAEHASALERQDYSIHFHTFTLTSFLALMLRAREAYGLPFEVVATETNNHEFIVIARKTATRAEAMSQVVGAGSAASFKGRARSASSPEAFPNLAFAALGSKLLVSRCCFRSSAYPSP
jgi:SAM-dependent methyltransferase